MQSIVEIIVYEIVFRMCTGLLRLVTFGKVYSAPYDLKSGGATPSRRFVERQADGTFMLQYDLAAWIGLLPLIALFVIAVLLLQRFVL